MKTPHLHRDWKKILRHAWSVRLLLFAALLQGGEVALPLIFNFVPVAYQVAFGALILLVIAGAFLSRIVAQKKFGAQ